MTSTCGGSFSLFFVSLARLGSVVFSACDMRGTRTTPPSAFTASRSCTRYSNGVGGRGGGDAFAAGATVGAACRGGGTACRGGDGGCAGDDGSACTGIASVTTVGEATGTGRWV